MQVRQLILLLRIIFPNRCKASKLMDAGLVAAFFQACFLCLLLLPLLLELLLLLLQQIISKRVKTPGSGIFDRSAGCRKRPLLWTTQVLDLHVKIQQYATILAAAFGETFSDCLCQRVLVMVPGLADCC